MPDKTQYDVAPAPGVTPAQAATQLRITIKRLWKAAVDAAAGNPSQVPASTDKRVAEIRQIAYDGRKKTQQQNVAVLGRHTRMVEKLNEAKDLIPAIITAGKSRRSADVAQYATRLKVALDLLGMQQAEELAYAKAMYASAYDALNAVRSIATSIAASPASVTGQQLLAGLSVDEWREVYALVQVLPTYDNMPSEASETTIRAITAIVKAHHGLALEGIEQVPDPGDLPLVLIHQVKEQQQEQTEPARVPASYGPDPFWAPFTITSTSGASIQSSVKRADTDNGYWKVDDGLPGDVSNWNDGNCSYDDALKALRAVRRQYSDAQFFLLARDGDTVASVKTGEPMVVYLGSSQASSSNSLTNA